MATEILFRYGRGMFGERSTIRLNLEDGTVTVAGVPMSAKEWDVLAAGIDRALVRTGFVVQNKRTPNPSVTASRFVVENIRKINAMTRGRIKKAPLLLRWCYDYVVSKEELK